MKATVATVYNWINAFAPFSAAMDDDNVGLLVGNSEKPVTRVLCALDCTLEVAEEAREMGAELICAHHPLMYHPRRSITMDDAEARLLSYLLKHDLSLITAHTNLDVAPQGINFVLGNLLGLSELTFHELIAMGRLSTPLTAGAFAKRAAKALRHRVRVYGDENLLISRLGLAGGGYSEGHRQAKALGADAYFNGEIKHHDAIEAHMEGMVIFEGGHYATEAPGFAYMAQCLQKGLNELQYKVAVLTSRHVSYPGALDVTEE